MKAVLCLILVLIALARAQVQISFTCSNAARNCDALQRCYLGSANARRGCARAIGTGGVPLNQVLIPRVWPSVTGTQNDPFNAADFTACGFVTPPWIVGSTSNQCQSVGNRAGFSIAAYAISSLNGDARTYDFYRNSCIGSFSSLPTHNTQPASSGTSITNDYSVTYSFTGVCLASSMSRLQSGANTNVQGNRITWTLQGTNSATDILLFRASNLDPTPPLVNQPTTNNVRDIFWALNRQSSVGSAPVATVSQLSFFDAGFFRGQMFFVGDAQLTLSNVVFEGFDASGRYSSGRNMAESGASSRLVSAFLIESQCGVPSSTNIASASQSNDRATACSVSGSGTTSKPTVTLNSVTVRGRSATRSLAYITQLSTTSDSITLPVRSAQTNLRNLFSAIDESVWVVSNLIVEDQRFTNANGGVLFASSSTITISQSTFRRNTARQTTGTIAGGLFHFRYRSNVTFTTSTFTSNTGTTSTANGFNGLCVYQEDSTFEQINYRSNGIYTSNTFTTNTHAGNGAGYYFLGEDLAISLSLNTFTTNTASLAGFSTTVNSGVNAKGGAIFTNGIVDANMWNNAYSGNTADQGGCFYFSATKLYQRFRTTDNIRDNKIIDNKDVGFNRGRGGGGAMSIADNSYIVFDTPTFTSNSAQYGGAIEIRDSTLMMKSATFTNNQASYFTNFTRELHGAGGAIRAFDSIVQIESSTFSGNWGHNGGSIYAYSSSGRTQTGVNSPITNPSLSLNKVTFNAGSRTAAHGVYEGGALYVESVDLIVKESTFTGLISKKGGAVRLVTSVDEASNNGHAAEFRKSVFVNNRAQGTPAEANPLPGTTPDFAGGAIAADKNIRVVDSHFNGNWVSLGNGGAIAAYRGAIIENTLFEANGASFQKGGAIFSMPTVVEELLVKDSDFRANVAGNGGAIYSGNPMTTIDRSSFHSNLAEITGVTPPIGNGGAITLSNRATITASSFFSNLARHSGGAVYTSAQLTVTDSSFNQNQATTSVALGGAIRCISNPRGVADARLSVESTTFTANTANNGGAVWSSCDNMFTSATFSSNTASLATGAGSIFCHNGNRLLTGCSINVKQSSFTGSSPSAIFSDEAVSSSITNGWIRIWGSTFTGPTEGVWANANVRFYSAAQSMGVTSVLNQNEVRVWGAVNAATFDGISMLNGAQINANNLGAVTVASLAADSTSRLNIENVATARTVGTTNVGALSFSPNSAGNPLVLGGPIFLLAGGVWTGNVRGAHNITIMAGTAQWTGGDVGQSGDATSYVNIMMGATFQVGSHPGNLYKNIKNWGTLRFEKTNPTGGIIIGSGIMIQNAWRATISCGTGVQVRQGPIATPGLAAGAWIHSWGNMTFTEQCQFDVSVILYSQSYLVFGIRSENDFDRVTFGGFAQMAGGVVGLDRRNFIDENNQNIAGGQWNNGRDFGTAYPVIRLRSSYNERLHSRFANRKVHYIRNACTGQSGCVGNPVFFPVAANDNQRPYIRYGPNPNRSVLFLVNPASLMSVSPFVFLVALIFSLW